MIKTLKEHDFRLSGKVLLAAAILLKIKSNRWVKEDIANLDAMFASAEQDEEDLLAALYAGYAEGGIVQDYDIEELIRFLGNQRG